MNLFVFQKNTKAGLSYIETIVAVAIFTAVSIMLNSTYARVFTVARTSLARVNATALADEQFELAHNLSFSQIGTVGGAPSGVMKRVQTLTRGGMVFIATTTVRNIDQPFDGVAGGTPNDLAPADNKLVEIEINCISCARFTPLVFTTWIAPQNLEGSSTNGALFVKVIDAAGLAIQGADVSVFNASATPPIAITDITSTSGLLQLIDVPPGNQAYQIAVSKAGYSSELTYGAPTTTNPVKPHATVAAQSVTQLTFGIDRTATLNFSGVSPSCAVVPNTNIHMTGAKLINTAPDLPKYDKWTKTNALGALSLNNIEWDTYSLTATSTSYELAGVTPLQPFAVLPGSTQNIQLVMVAKNQPSIVVTVKDIATGLPITGATVTLAKGGASTTNTTGRGFLSQTDWSGGAGQSDYLISNMYAADDTNVDVLSVPGQVSLWKILGLYQPSGTLYSSTFDTGSVSNFYQFTYQPTSQAPATSDSVRFQIATGNSTSSWTYLGPDGTTATFYNSTTTNISAVNNGNRYLRYKMMLSTASTTLTPTVSDIQFTFTSNCVPPGQVIFQGLANGTYTITISKAPYLTLVDSITIDGTIPWQEKSEIMSP